MRERRAVILASLFLLVVFVTAANVVRCKAVTGDGGYYTDQLLAEEVSRYLESEGVGRWFGRGAERLGLRPGSVVSHEVFKHLMRGYGPDLRPLVRNAGAKNRQSATEIHLSTSKSFDVLYALATPEERLRLKAIFIRAIDAVLERIEREHAYTRRGHGGPIAEPADFVFARFIHETNRLGEPFLHCHCVCLNVSVRADGTTGTILTKPLYEFQRLGSVLMDLYVADGIRREFGIEVVRDRFSFHIPGVPKSLTKAWSTRRGQIDEWLRTKGEESPKAAEKAARKTRTKKQLWHMPERLKTWEAEALAHGIDIAKILGRDQTRTAPRERNERDALEAVREAAESVLVRGKSPFTRRELSVEAGLLALWRGISPEFLLPAVDEAIARPLEHRLLGAGMSRKGEALYQYWDPPEPKPVTRIPEPVTPQPEQGAELLPQTGLPRPGSEITPEHHALSQAPRTGGREGPLPSNSREIEDAHPRRPRSATAREANRETPSIPGSQHEEFSRAYGSLPEWAKELGTIQTLAGRLLTEPVRSFLVVKEAAKTLVTYRGHFTVDELVEVAVRLAKDWGLPKVSVWQAVDRFLAHPVLNGIVLVGEREGEGLWTSRRHERAERKLVSEADRLSRARCRPVKKHVLDEAARRLLSHGEELVQALRKLTHRGSRLSLLDCRAGEERNHLVRELGRVYEQAGFNVRWVAPSAAAAEALTRQTGKAAVTVAQLIQRASKKPILEVLGWMLSHESRSLGAKLSAAEKVRKPFEELTRKDVVLVLDSHLLGTREGEKVTTLVRKAGAKLILVGDRDRAPGLYAGGGFKFLAERHHAAEVRPRTLDDRPETAAANFLRQGRATSAHAALIEANRIHDFPNLARAAEELLDHYRVNDGLFEPRRHLVVTSTNREAKQLNRRIQREREEEGLLGLASVKVRGGLKVRAGDRVVFTRSSYPLGVKAGHAGIVSSVNPIVRSVTVRLDTGSVVTVPISRFPHLTLGYATSVPRASELSAAYLYALTRGGGFFRQSLIALLEQATERVEVFTPLSKASVRGLFARDGGKTLAISHRAQTQVPSQERDHDPYQWLHHDLQR